MVTPLIILTLSSAVLPEAVRAGSLPSQFPSSIAVAGTEVGVVK